MSLVDLGVVVVLAGVESTQSSSKLSCCGRIVQPEWRVFRVMSEFFWSVQLVPSIFLTGVQ